MSLSSAGVRFLLEFFSGSSSLDGFGVEFGETIIPCMFQSKVQKRTRI